MQSPVGMAKRNPHADAAFIVDMDSVLDHDDLYHAFVYIASIFGPYVYATPHWWSLVQIAHGRKGQKLIRKMLPYRLWGVN